MANTRLSARGDVRPPKTPDYTLFLKAFGAHRHDTPTLFLKPVFVDPDTGREALAVPSGIPSAGVTDIALMATIDCLSGALKIGLVSTAQFPGPDAMGAIAREMQMTSSAIARREAQSEMRTLTVGECCAAWCQTYNMQGVLIPRSPGEEQQHGFQLIRDVKPAVDRYLQHWAERARANFVPIEAQIAAVANPNYTTSA